MKYINPPADDHRSKKQKNKQLCLKENILVIQMKFTKIIPKIRQSLSSCLLWSKFCSHIKTGKKNILGEVLAYVLLI